MHKKVNKFRKKNKKGKGKSETYSGNTPLACGYIVASLFYLAIYTVHTTLQSTVTPLQSHSNQKQKFYPLADLVRTPIITNTAPHQQTTSRKTVPAEH
jgi:hypothetical protein